MSRMTEAKWQAEVLVALSAMPDVRVWRQNAGRFRSLTGNGVIIGAPTGAADITGIVMPHGWRLEVECKVDAPFTAEQAKWARFVREHGGLYVLARYRDAHDGLAGNLAYLAAHLRTTIAARASNTPFDSTEVET